MSCLADVPDVSQGICFMCDYMWECRYKSQLPIFLPYQLSTLNTAFLYDSSNGTVLTWISKASCCAQAVQFTAGYDIAPAFLLPRNELNTKYVVCMWCVKRHVKGSGNFFKV